MNTLRLLTVITVLTLLCMIPLNAFAFSNGGFETGDFTDWSTVGEAFLVDDTFGTGPAEGTHQAVLTTLGETTDEFTISGIDAVPAEYLETFLGLLPGDLSNLGIVEGTAIQQTFSANERHILTFDFNFLTDEPISQSAIHDRALVFIDGVRYDLANISPAFPSTSATEFMDETGFFTFSHTFTASGSHTLAIVVADHTDNIGASALVVDNVVLFSPVDSDGDSIPDSSDNCPDIANTDQSDYDHDGDGDACDLDDDNDGLTDEEEVNVYGTDPLNVDTDGDGLTDSYEIHVSGTDPLNTDSDSDTVQDDQDNCPQVANTNQSDDDEDEVGNACDNCLGVYNSTYGDCDDCLNDLRYLKVALETYYADYGEYPATWEETLFTPTEGINIEDYSTDPYGYYTFKITSSGGDWSYNVDSRTTLITVEYTDINSVLHVNKQWDHDQDGIGDACDTCPLEPNNDPGPDGDGIDGEIDGYMDAGTFVDESSEHSRNFTDQHLGGTTYGVVGVQDVALITVEDVPTVGNINWGVLIHACGTFYRQKQIPTYACGMPINLTSGDQLIVTCGSMTAEVLVGPIEFPLSSDRSVTVPSEATVRIAEVAEGVFAVENIGDTGTITIKDQGQVTELDPGTSEYLGHIELEIDIKPGSDPNCFNLNGKGVIPVAINGSDDFHVTNINVSSLDFAGLEVRVKNNGIPQCSIEDWNEDGFDDLVCQFVDDPDRWTVGDTEASLTGSLNDGTPIRGTDSICIVP